MWKVSLDSGRMAADYITFRYSEIWKLDEVGGRTLEVRKSRKCYNLRLSAAVINGSIAHSQLFRHRAHRSRQVDPRRPLPRDDRRPAGARDGSAGARLDGPRARARDHDQGARRPAHLPCRRWRDLRAEPD